MKFVAEYITGSCRGYVRVADRGAETQPERIPEDLTGERGNFRRALAHLRDKGATYYTIANYQGVPDKGYSNQYCYSIYRGYSEEA